ncbi:hypothetical protein V6N13_010192 [Hibiscus sabdariffa]
MLLHWSGLRKVFGRFGDVVDSFIESKLHGFYLYGAKIEVSYAKFNRCTSYWRKLRNNTRKQNVNGANTKTERQNRNDKQNSADDLSKDSRKHVKRIVGHVEEESM